MLLNSIDKVPLMRSVHARKDFSSIPLPNDRTSFRLLETQRHIRAILLSPDNQSLWIA